jgi:multidrug resistance efflux pump
MLELLICSMLTILPDYLFRRYRQGRRIGHEITLYSVWFELRWGIVTCLMLTVLVITVIFYNHPTTANVTAYFRTIPVISEVNGRVAEIYARFGDTVEAGDKIFRLDSNRQEAALETARRKLDEVEASMAMARADALTADGQVQQARGAAEQASDELRTKLELRQRNADIVAQREIERLQKSSDSAEGALAAAQAMRQSAETRLTTLIPAQKASAEAAVQQAQVDLDKTIIYAGVKGKLEQFVLQVGDLMTPFRPAGVLIPVTDGPRSLQAGFSQIEAKVIKLGMYAEATCISQPLTVIPLFVSRVQDVIAAGQFRTTEVLAEANQTRGPGSILVFLQPLYANGLDGVMPGSSCVANLYSNNHDTITAPGTGAMHKLYLHGVDALAVVHAAILRIQTLMLPVKLLVFAGH